jgi:hypothetical protein
MPGEAVSVTNRAANVIPRIRFGTYIFISLSVGEISERRRVANYEGGMLIEQVNKENDSGHS